MFNFFKSKIMSQNNNQSEKVTIYNLIILDESGSMSCVAQQTISGCNETINNIKSLQEEHAVTQQHFISIYAFQHNPKVHSRYLIKNENPSMVHHITDEDYQPWGSTNLYDAIGSTLSDIKHHIKNNDKAIGNITIITDGMENASCEYTHAHIAKMIEDFKEKGWNFNFIGANIDVEATAHNLNIDNHLSFAQDEENYKRMWEAERSSQRAYYKRMERTLKDEDDSVSFAAKMRTISKNYFDATDED